MTKQNPTCSPVQRPVVRLILTATPGSPGGPGSPGNPTGPCKERKWSKRRLEELLLGHNFPESIWEAPFTDFYHVGLTGLPFGPSSPGGPLAPAGPAAPGGPASPFSPLSPLGPCSDEARDGGGLYFFMSASQEAEFLRSQRWTEPDIKLSSSGFKKQEFRAANSGGDCPDCPWMLHQSAA